ncbi:hypothetical protein C1886_03200 [Pseudomonas sp. FW300-N1A1]|nr:hypothetical protein C1886_03200 [Pseudomonas sp. FW300-N1A1]
MLPLGCVAAQNRHPRYACCTGEPDFTGASHPSGSKLPRHKGVKNRGIGKQATTFANPSIVRAAKPPRNEVLLCPSSKTPEALNRSGDC